MGNSISNQAPTPLSTNTTAKSFNLKVVYTIKSTLGTGTHGTVYRVSHSSTKQVMAMKVIRTTTAAQFKLFKQEATFLVSLSHTNIVTLEDIAGVVDAETGLYNACIIMPLAEQTLESFYVSYTALGISGMNEAMAQTTAYQILCALEYLHGENIVHRDLKPANVLVFQGSRSQPLLLKLSDFGISASIYDESGTSQGAARYTSPEALLRNLPSHLLPKTDVWALGMLVKDMLTGALLHPHVKSTGLSEWAKETTAWMLQDEILKRPTAKECREAVWVRQGRRVPRAFLRALDMKGIGCSPRRDSDDEDEEMGM
ncbi:kinase-like protein [Aureobasidium pullulans]|uniref:mitogen-activated protein kinase kinase n=1 Tax=Aureobasidium pullulans TaxID=5580 RepID=A0A4V4I8K9_AURPU|nr:kinase-like protein [Aureobasidium pullulans]THW10773.1 kinase-like protein [Aureobasidium pullulans]THX09822.1 kinase-like protein [Aureobasidium pullulans]THZ77713.1 kinase-like protein [Aureobasidium pullulans]